MMTYLGLVYSTASSSNKTKFENGVNMWNVSGAACGTYSVSGSMDFSGAGFQTLNHETVTTLSNACGVATKPLSSSSLDKVTILVGANSCGWEVETSAHEVGHILGLSHILSDPDHLLSPGTNGMLLEDWEIAIARERALVLAGSE